MIGTYDIAELHLMVMEDEHPEMEVIEERLLDLEKFCHLLDLMVLNGEGDNVTFTINDDYTITISAIVYCVILNDGNYGKWEDLFDLPKQVKIEFMYREQPDDDDTCVQKMTFEIPTLWKERQLN